MRANWIIITFLICLAIGPSYPTWGAEEGTVDFVRDVVPIFQAQCIRCHRPENRKGDVSLATAADVVATGFVVAGKVDESDLLGLITPQGGKPPRMPKEGPPLSAAQVETIRRWIATGASWPDTVVIREASRAGRDWWSLQPVGNVVVPDLPAATGKLTADWNRNPIDRFVLDKLSASGLHPSTEADRRVLIRRLMFDLHGLPPDPSEIDAFVTDADPQAYDRLVDRLLASPRYGERWARHWLDIAHYADTHGFERDQRRDTAWRYRDWVIQALNSDLPYDQFLQDQIAGDVLRPDDPAAVIATGFLSAGPWDFVGQAETKSEVLKRAARADDLDDMVTQVLTATCGLTVNCARCHDHKLDPIPQRDYYGLWAVFAGVKRGERDVSAREVRELDARKQALRTDIQQVNSQIAKLRGPHFDLADIVGGGNGLLTGKTGQGIDQLTGNLTAEKRGFVEGVKPNTFVRSGVKFIDGVVVPDASPEGTTISSTGLRIQKVPKTSRQVWDAIRLGPVNSHFSTKLDGIDFSTSDHTLLSLHANAAITFDLDQLRQAGAPGEMKFTSAAGYFGQTPKAGASLAVYIDGEVKLQRDRIGRDDGLIPIEITIPKSARFLTLLATDAGNGIGHDQVCFGDPWLSAVGADQATDNKDEIARLVKQRTELEQQLSSIPTPTRVYGILTESPATVKVLKWGDPEQTDHEVVPTALSCIANLKPELGTSQTPEGDRRRAFAEWVTSPDNPLTRRVIVNRLWHYHFGVGLVDTPSDFGFGGGRPSHPELLDWLAGELLRQRWSLKQLHRLICTSQTYRQQSHTNEQSGPAMRVDAGNRLLWRMNSRRLDAESLRDAVLSVSGRLNPQMFGPGYRDFEYQEEYAPVYKYITPDQPELWRRSIYRFSVRTTTHQFLTTLDCPSPANLVPTRNVTTTALQSLALMNNDFMLKQSGYLAKRLVQETTDPANQIQRAFRLVFNRNPTGEEEAAARTLVRTHGLDQFGRILFNANEFVYVD